MIDRYSSNEMKRIFSDEHKFEHFLEVEKSVVEAYHSLGTVSEEDLTKICNNARVDIDRINELELETKHDVIAFTRSLSEQLGNEKRWIHYSLTSTDVVDTAQSLTLREANDIIDKDIIKLLNTIKEKALTYKNQPIIGRTHGMHAEITSFGLKWALFYDELLRDYASFKEAREKIEIVKLSGAVGNYANIDPKIEEYVAKKFGMNASLISTQVLSRDRHLSYMFSLSLISSCLEKIATEIRHLSRTEISEVAEYFSGGQKGSSAMPHKKNPIASENICGCSRVVRSYMSAMYENNCLWHERDISHSSAERIILPDAISLLDYMLKRMDKIIDKLIVNKERMIKNIGLTNGLCFSGRILQLLIDKGLSREESYDLIQKLTFEVDESNSFYEIVRESIVKDYLSQEEIKECLNMDYYLKNVDYIYRRLGIL